jgi:hypothetical protein
MYSNDSIDKLIKSAENVVFVSDRSLYVGYFVELEKYCADKSVVIGGKAGISLLVGEKTSKDSFVYDLYIDDTYNHAKAIADTLWKYGESVGSTMANTISVETKIKHKLFSIWIGLRPVIIIHALDKYRDVKLVDLIGPINVAGRFGDSHISVLSPEVQLIMIYKTLYCPYSTRDHDSIAYWLNIEKVLYKQMESVIMNKATKEITGGATNIQSNPNIVKLIRGVIDGLTGNHLLIGDFAIFPHEINKISTNNPLKYRLQIITADDIKVYEGVIRKMIKSIVGATYDLNVVRYDLKIPTDNFLLKYTFYISHNETQTPLFDVFNSTSHEVIPWSHNIKNLRVAGDLVIIRFKLIDLYATRLILNLKTSNQEFMRRKIHEIIGQISGVRNRVLAEISSDPLKVFKITNQYVGNYIDEIVALKKKIIDKNDHRMFGRYYPVMELAKKPVVDAPVVDAPVVDAPVVDAPVVENTMSTDRRRLNTNENLYHVKKNNIKSYSFAIL